MGAERRGMGVVRLTDSKVPSRARFRFELGDRVAWGKGDGSPDMETVGRVVEGECKSQIGGGFSGERYLVQREKDGGKYWGDGVRLVKVE